MTPGKYLCVLLIYYILKALTFSSDQSFHLYFLNVGQGDSILAHLPSNKNVLIDTGPDYTFDYQLSKILHESKTIFYYFLTHPHADHSGGEGKLYSRYEVMDSEFLYAGDSLNFDGLSLKFLWPLPECDSNDLNYCSQVMLLSYKNFDCLLTGDATSEVLDSLDLDLSDNVLDCYKVSHHGSTNGHAPGLIRKYRPAMCVVSVGENTFGHPKDSVISELESFCGQVLQTRYTGNIVLPVR